MAEHPLQIFERLDPQFFKLVQSTRELAYADGALSQKFKLLIGMAIDASKGSTSGVKSLAQRAMQAGATKEELIEALRVAHCISGAGSVFTAAPAFRELF